MRLIQYIVSGKNKTEYFYVYSLTFNAFISHAICCNTKLQITLAWLMQNNASARMKRNSCHVLRHR